MPETKLTTKEAAEKRAVALASDLLLRSSLADRAAMQFGTDRDMWETLGYDSEIKLSDYYARFRRNALAGRIVDAPAQTTWREPPIVRGVDEGDGGAFEEAIRNLDDRLSLWHYMERADRLAGVGHYSVILLGSKRADSLEDPLLPSEIGQPDDLAYLSVYREEHAPVESFVEDTTDPRFGRPEIYEIDILGDLVTTESNKKRGSLKARARTSDNGIMVHWSRVIHVAEDLLEDEVYGRPRLERVWNLLDDMLKTTGGSAEMLWNNVAGIWWANVNNDADLDADDLSNLEEQILAALHGLRRFVGTRGVDDLTQVGGATPDPSGVFKVQQSLVAAATGIPQRMLFGSEKGELASTQDEATWFGVVAERRQKFAEPMIVRALLDRFIALDVLAAPANGYEVEWPDLYQLDDMERAELASKKALALKNAAPMGDTSAVVSIEEIRTEFLELPAQRPDQPAINAFRDEEDRESEAEVQRHLR